MGLFGKSIERRKVKRQVSKLMKDYDKERIDGATFAQKIFDLSSSVQEKKRK